MISKNQIKYIRQLGSKKYREEYGRYIVEGEKMVSLAFAKAMPVVYCVCLPDWADRNRELFLNNPELKVLTANERELSRCSNMKSAPPVLAVLEMESSDKEVETKLSPGLYLYLQSLRDPGNLGTIIRTADWFGLQGIYCSPDSVEAYNPKVVQASMGSIFSITPYTADLRQLTGSKQDIYTVAADIRGEDPAKVKFPKDRAVLLVVGNESHGLDETILRDCDNRICIPGSKEKTAESLNAAVATAVLCYAIKFSGGVG